LIDFDSNAISQISQFKDTNKPFQNLGWVILSHILNCETSLFESCFTLGIYIFSDSKLIVLFLLLLKKLFDIDKTEDKSKSCINCFGISLINLLSGFLTYSQK
jgi:hypothetical protein